MSRAHALLAALALALGGCRNLGSVTVGLGAPGPVLLGDRLHLGTGPGPKLREVDRFEASADAYMVAASGSYDTPTHRVDYYAEERGSSRKQSASPEALLAPGGRLLVIDEVGFRRYFNVYLVVHHWTAWSGVEGRVLAREGSR